MKPKDRIIRRSRYLIKKYLVAPTRLARQGDIVLSESQGAHSLPTGRLLSFQVGSWELQKGLQNYRHFLQERKNNTFISTIQHLIFRSWFCMLSMLSMLILLLPCQSHVLLKDFLKDSESFFQYSFQTLSVAHDTGCIPFKETLNRILLFSRFQVFEIHP